MNTQLKKIGLGLMLAVMPVMAASASAQWTQQNQSAGVTLNIGDVAPQATSYSYDVTVDQNGTLFGQVAVIDAAAKTAAGYEGVNVFFARDGEIIKQTQTQADGSFEVQGLEPGAYSFFAAGNSGFAAYGVNVIQNAAQPTVLEATMASASYAGIQQVLNNNLPEEVAKSIELTSDAEGTPMQSTKQIRLINGRLNGQIANPFAQGQAAGVQVHLIQNNQPVAQVQTNADGNFAIPDVQPGIYDFVAATKDGLVAIRFEAIELSPMTRVSYRAYATGLKFALAQTETQGRVIEPVNENLEVDYVQGSDVLMEPANARMPNGNIEYVGESIGYGAAQGGTAGSVNQFGNFQGGGLMRGRFAGRRFGGNSGMGRLLTGAGFGLSVIAIADDDPAPGSPIK